MPRHDKPAPVADASLGTGLRWDALVVAGGRATRLGGIDKTALVWRGHSLLDGVLAATTGSERTCVVGSDADLPADVLRAVEQPRWGGPAAAMVAGLDALARESGGITTGTDSAGPDWIVVLAGDLVHADHAVPYLLAELHRLVASPQAGAPQGTPAGTAAHRRVDGVISVDAGGRRQPLLAVYRRAALESSALLRPADNLSVMSLIGPLNLVELRLPDALGDDVDTPADAARLGIVLPHPSAPPGTPQHER